MNEEDFTPCEECVQPDSCLTRCGIKEYIQVNQNIAQQRGETPEQLWGEKE